MIFMESGRLDSAAATVACHFHSRKKCAPITINPFLSGFPWPDRTFWVIGVNLLHQHRIHPRFG